MAATSRKASRVLQRRAAPPPAGRKPQRVAKPGRNGGRADAGNGGPVKAKAAKRTADRAAKSGKMVRDTFKMPQREYALIAELKRRCRDLGVEVKKSEVLRAGLLAMRELSDERLGEVMKPLTAARAGRAARKQAKSATAA